MQFLALRMIVKLAWLLAIYLYMNDNQQERTVQHIGVAH